MSKVDIIRLFIYYANIKIFSTYCISRVGIRQSCRYSVNIWCYFTMYDFNTGNIEIYFSIQQTHQFFSFFRFCWKNDKFFTFELKSFI